MPVGKQDMSGAVKKDVYPATTGHVPPIATGDISLARTGGISPSQFELRRDYPSPNVFVVLLLHVEVKLVVRVAACDG